MTIYTTEKVNLVYKWQLLLPFQFLCILAKSHPQRTGAPLLSCAEYVVLMISLDSAGAGEFLLLLQQSCLQTALADHKCCLSLHSSGTQSCSWKASFILFHILVEMLQCQSRLWMHHHSLPCAPLQKLKQLFMARLGVITQTEHAELEAPRNLRTSTECGKLGSTQNFQMGKSSSMCS